MTLGVQVFIKKKKKQEKQERGDLNPSPTYNFEG